MEDTSNTTNNNLVIDIEDARLNTCDGIQGRIQCPFCCHNHSYEKRNSRDMSVHLQMGLYNCFRCGVKGRLKGEQYESVRTNRVQLKFIRREVVEFDFPKPPVVPLDETKSDNDNSDAQYEAERQAAISPEVARWAEERGLRPETLFSYGVRCEGRKLYAPTKRAGIIVNVETRVTDSKNFWNVTGAPHIMYNLDEMVRPFNDDMPEGEGYLAYDTMIIVEGRADVWAAAEAGYYNVVSVPNGATASVESYINDDPDVMKILRELSKVVLAVDSDEEGKQLRQNLIEAIGVEKCRIVEYHEDCKDIGDVLRLHGAKGVIHVLEKTFPASSASSASTSDSACADKLVLETQAFHGLAGDIVRAIEPESEADPAALLVQTLVAFGNCIGRKAHIKVEADKHYMNLFAVLVGKSSKGRKGTSWGQVSSFFERVDEDWVKNCLQSGLSSGEGLIWAVRDPIEKQEPIRDRGNITGYQPNKVDFGVEDKRCLVMQSEFAQTLKVMAREGNTLSAVVREAWDKGDMRMMTKNSPAQATGGHVSIIGHITKDELRRNLQETETANGFANRFLWVGVERSKLLPFGGNLTDEKRNPLVQRLQRAITFARGVERLNRGEAADALWSEIYARLSVGHEGLVGAVTSRAEAQVLRLSCLYALLDCSAVVKSVHLEAAHALWRYCEASARFVFGRATGDKVADTILAALRAAGDRGLTQSELNKLFSGHKGASLIATALVHLLEKGFVRCQPEETGGRTATRWFAVVGTAEKAEEAEKEPESAVVLFSATVHQNQKLNVAA